MPGGFLQEDELNSMFDNMLKLDVKSITSELSNLLDFNLKETKKFIKELTDRIKQQRQYEEQVKKI